MSLCDVNPQSVLLITLDSCRYDTFVAAHAPNMKGVGSEIHRAQAPSHFTYGSHLSMFVGFTPGIAGAERPYVNPKFAKLFRVHNEGRRPHGPAAFELQGRSIAQGFGHAGYRTLGSGAMAWFNPRRPHGEYLTADFGKFFYPGDAWSVDRQAAWFDAELDSIKGTPVFAFLNVGETHAPYWHKGARWSAADNPCVPFQQLDRSADCAARQRSCLEYIDASLAKLLSRFAGATIIVTADHGDCWGEDGLWEHTICHEAVLNVPLVFRVNPDIDADRSRRHAWERKSLQLKNLAVAMSHDAAQRVLRNPQIIWSQVDDETLGIHPDNGRTFRLNETAALVWEYLDLPRSEAEICAHLRQHYEVAETDCRAAVGSLLAGMYELGLLQEKAGSATPQQGCRAPSTTVTPESILSLREDITVTTMDGEVVLADTVNELYHAAGSVGSRVIGLLDGRRSAREIAATLIQSYDVEARACEREVLAFLRKMQDQRLLVVTQEGQHITSCHDSLRQERGVCSAAEP
jgi:Coenzyme PQQ synthesis protein D (PqqD)